VTAAETERVRVIQDRTARTYDRRISFWERVLFGSGRRWVCSQAGGDVLELAVGTGRNLPFYGEHVRLTGIDVSAEMLAVGKRGADRLAREVDLRLGDAQDLDFADASFDTVVVTLGLCTIPDDRRRRARRIGCCVRAVGCFCWSTSAVRRRRSGWGSGCSTR
jgi:ubiquinone/menaquinone biosynthesis C-methylase UbiE